MGNILRSGEEEENYKEDNVDHNTSKEEPMPLQGQVLPAYITRWGCERYLPVFRIQSFGLFCLRFFIPFIYVNMSLFLVVLEDTHGVLDFGEGYEHHPQRRVHGILLVFLYFFLKTLFFA